MCNKKLQNRAADYVYSKLFFLNKEIEERQLELDGVIRTFIDLDLVEKMKSASEEQFNTMLYLQDLIEADLLSGKCDNNCKKKCNGKV